jgi:hypothetical protein
MNIMKNHYNGFIINTNKNLELGEALIIEQEIELYTGWVAELTHELSNTKIQDRIDNIKAEIHSFSYAINLLRNQNNLQQII